MEINKRDPARQHPLPRPCGQGRQRDAAADVGPLKVYVPVEVQFRSDGVMLPRMITWEDGTRYQIDRVTDIRQAAAMRAGGQGDRYTVFINGKQSYLFFERSAQVVGCRLGRWFVERKTEQ